MRIAGIVSKQVYFKVKLIVFSQYMKCVFLFIPGVLNLISYYFSVKGGICGVENTYDCYVRICICIYINIY